jgi:hypothetical protein
MAPVWPRYMRSTVSVWPRYMKPWPRSGLSMQGLWPQLISLDEVHGFSSASLHEVHGLGPASHMSVVSVCPRCIQSSRPLSTLSLCGTCLRKCKHSALYIGGNKCTVLQLHLTRVARFLARRDDSYAAAVFCPRYSNI